MNLPASMVMMVKVWSASVLGSIQTSYKLARAGYWLLL